MWLLQLWSFKNVFGKKTLHDIFPSESGRVNIDGIWVTFKPFVSQLVPDWRCYVEGIMYFYSVGVVKSNSFSRQGEQGSDCLCTTVSCIHDFAEITLSTVCFARGDWAILIPCTKKEEIWFNLRMTYIYTHSFGSHINKAMQAHSIILTISSQWIMTLHCIYTDTPRNPNTCTQSVLYTRQSHTPPYPLLKLPRLRCESMYQSSESRWDRNPLIDLWLQSKCTEAGLPRLRKNTERRHNGGTTVEGKAEEITSQALQGCSAGGGVGWGGLLVVLRKEHMGPHSQN